MYSDLCLDWRHLPKNYCSKANQPFQCLNLHIPRRFSAKQSRMDCTIDRTEEICANTSCCSCRVDLTPLWAFQVHFNISQYTSQWWVPRQQDVPRNPQNWHLMAWISSGKLSLGSSSRSINHESEIHIEVFTDDGRCIAVERPHRQISTSFRQQVWHCIPFDQVSKLLPIVVLQKMHLS